MNRTFLIKVTMRDRWIPHFIGMLKYMEQIGNIGASRRVSIYSDGDGDFNPKFKFLGVDVEPAPPVEDKHGHRLYDAG